MSKDREGLSPEEAVDHAFEYFDKFVARGKVLDSVLLEGLEPQEDGWCVTIGFNGKRQEISEPASTGTLAMLGAYGKKTTTLVREIRNIFIGEDGKFLRMS